MQFQTPPTLIRLLIVLGLASAGSVAMAAHPAIFLLDKNYDEINPITGENADQPFSTAATCGSCHDYEEITAGYHFQMGWDVVADDFGEGTSKPWDISNGMMGKWCPMYLRQVASKENSSADHIDLTVYDFVGEVAAGSGLSCGSCHPGGGGMEFDRDGNRYDEILADDPDLRESLDGDYHKSNWDKSGVVEADCLICHLEGYSFDDRADQLKERNYQWAIVAGSGLGMVEGSVRRDQEPTVTYNTRFFNQDGSITFKMEWPPPDDNCVFCHGRADVRKRGFSWNDVFNPDIHNEQGLSCTACHPSGPDHQFAKGNATDLRVADHLDGTNRNCEECHLTGYMGATVPKHSKIRPSHLKQIACEACHIPSLGRTAVEGIDATTGTLEYYLKSPDAEEMGDTATWYPDYDRWEDNKIYPFNGMLVIWWGNLEADGLIHPLWLSEHKAGWDLFADQVTDDNGDDRVEVNRPEEIIAGLKAFATTIAANSRFTEAHPVYVKGGVAYHFDSTGQLGTITDFEPADCVDYSITHNVTAARSALGANGCDDCHAEEVHFFKGRRVLDMFDADGNQVTRSNGRYYGCNPTSFAINTFHQQILSPIVSIAIILALFLTTLHYHSRGPKNIPFVPSSGEVPRFTLIERGVHLFRLISFVLLTITGLIMAFNWHAWQDLLFRSPQQMLDIHIWSGVVFIITTAWGLILWWHDAFFASYDKIWVRKAGGYLDRQDEDIPAGRFNAGQKMFFWYSGSLGLIMTVSGVVLVFKSIFTLSTICITSTVHNLAGFVLIAGVLSHAYLGTIANPGTWRVLVDGYVTRIWARHHHPNWYRSLIEKNLITRELEDELHEADSEDNEAGEDEK